MLLWVQQTWGQHTSPCIVTAIQSLLGYSSPGIRWPRSVLSVAETQIAPAHHQLTLTGSLRLLLMLTAHLLSWLPSELYQYCYTPQVLLLPIGTVSSTWKSSCRLELGLHPWTALVFLFWVHIAFYLSSSLREFSNLWVYYCTVHYNNDNDKNVTLKSMMSLKIHVRPSLLDNE